ncbi:MAG: endonuclease/exonuclease/phosphatase family protein [Bacteroidaceae bacterium]|nr:endonuclease/exonuclease/phosphatase family protein [Bacteroidaceae bacterium]MDO4995055.1 endonuclease/exonuclease/phosphatase family protein [Bacteroidales bacterium]
MKKATFLSVLAVLCVWVLTAAIPQGRPGMIVYPIAFYNLENLFDTIHDVRMEMVDGVMTKVEDKNDYEYLPDGANVWGTMKYQAKLANMSKVLAEFATDRVPYGAAVVGVSEIENRRVLEDLLKQPALANRGWQIVHEEGPDRRGVDCAFFYNPKLFKYQSHKLVPYVYPPDEIEHKTRGFLVMTGTMGGELIHFIVNHLPSRGAVSFYRELGGKQIRAVKDSLQRDNPNCKIVIMGDMNDDPDDKSMAVSLGAKRKQEDCGPQDLWNPFWDTLRKNGVGTLKYQGKWNLFDQIMITGNMLTGKDHSTLSYLRHEVFIRDYLLQQTGMYKGSPLRTHAAGVWLNGYSDHLPTIVYVGKYAPQK